MASRALRIGLLPGDGIGREVIPVSYLGPTNITHKTLNWLINTGRSSNTRVHLTLYKAQIFLHRTPRWLRALSTDRHGLA